MTTNDSGDRRRPRIEWSLTQTVGGALAAMTAAALGSRLGVAGTVVGAAVASVIAGVAGALYTASLRGTRDRVKTVWVGRLSPTTVSTPAGGTVLPASSVPTRVAPQPQRRVPWKGMVVGALGIFVLAAAALTGLELVSGHALSGGRGTTVQLVGQPNPAPRPRTSGSKQTTRPPQTATPTPSPSGRRSPTPGPATARTPSPSPSLVAPSPVVPTPTTSASSAPSQPSPSRSPSVDRPITPTSTAPTVPAPTTAGPSGR